ncbi:hypothetical protein LMG29660_01290 [Burkholderia puraquae]|uniref:Uncharacterized protein n=1 Tax=Burkholderia puraquae TaxID=1904757 RepID=A0A6J5D7Y0_9BURK|nr:hypothetical protein LMG29660_01290 [Burkholderia puraquae]
MRTAWSKSLRKGRLGRSRFSSSIPGLAVMLGFPAGGPGSLASVATTCQHIEQAV